MVLDIMSTPVHDEYRKYGSGSGPATVQKKIKTRRESLFFTYFKPKPKLKLETKIKMRQ
jgi:hypothetical protein